MHVHIDPQPAARFTAWLETLVLLQNEPFAKAIGQEILLFVVIMHNSKI